MLQSKLNPFLYLFSPDPFLYLSISLPSLPPLTLSSDFRTYHCPYNKRDPAEQVDPPLQVVVLVRTTTTPTTIGCSCSGRTILSGEILRRSRVLVPVHLGRYSVGFSSPFLLGFSFPLSFLYWRKERYACSFLSASSPLLSFLSLSFSPLFRMKCSWQLDIFPVPRMYK